MTLAYPRLPAMGGKLVYVTLGTSNCSCNCALTPFSLCFLSEISQIFIDMQKLAASRFSNYVGRELPV